MNNQIILQIKNINKSFPGVKALTDVSLDVKYGEVHAICGENGAGKSTLMNILSGIYPPESGELYLCGQQIYPRSSIHAQKIGIAMIHQELSVSTNLTVAENISIGKYEANRFGIINKRHMEEKAKTILLSLGIERIQPSTLVRNLSISEMQLIEIAKAISKDPKVVIMDEPTSSLTTAEVKVLMKLINELKAKGVAILYISHKLEEVFMIADRISVLRDGCYIGTCRKEDTNENNIITMMVGRELGNQKHILNKNISGEILLSIKNLSFCNRVNDVSFDLRKGEILGFAGLVGAGRSELLATIFGVYKKNAGHIFFENRETNINSPRDAIKIGIGMIPEDRKLSGLFLRMNVRDNINITNLRAMRGKFLLRKKIENTSADYYIQELKIKTPTQMQLIRNLSGGNQQKTVLARWLMIKPKLILMDEPTHGIDVGAKAEIYNIMRMLTNSGVSIILVSSELPEILLMSDRIIVMRNGRISGELDREEATQERIMEYCTK